MDLGIVRLGGSQGRGHLEETAPHNFAHLAIVQQEEPRTDLQKRLQANEGPPIKSASSVAQHKAVEHAEMMIDRLLAQMPTDLNEVNLGALSVNLEWADHTAETMDKKSMKVVHFRDYVQTVIDMREATQGESFLWDTMELRTTFGKLQRLHRKLGIENQELIHSIQRDIQHVAGNMMLS